MSEDIRKGMACLHAFATSRYHFIETDILEHGVSELYLMKRKKPGTHKTVPNEKTVAILETWYNERQKGNKET